jgi:hypothetical protein
MYQKTTTQCTKIYKGLTNHMLAKYSGFQHLSLLNKEACLQSPTARTLYLLKHNGLVHIKTDNITFPHMDTPLATIWLQKIVNYPSITTSLNRKYLNQLLLLTITTLEQIILPNRTTMMNEKEFQRYHKKSTPTIKKALKNAAHLFCVIRCTNTCRLPYNIHQQTPTNIYITSRYHKPTQSKLLPYSTSRKQLHNRHIKTPETT